MFLKKTASMKLLLLLLSVIHFGFLMHLQASEVNIVLMDWYGNSIKLDPDQIKLAVNREIEVPFEAVQSQLKVQVQNPENATIVLRVLGFKQKSIMPKCGAAVSSCTVGVFLEVANTVDMERSGKLKAIFFPQSWKGKGRIFVSMVFLGSSHRIDFVLKNTNSVNLPLEEYGLASITIIFEDGTKTSMLYSFNAYDERVEINK